MSKTFSKSEYVNQEIFVEIFQFSNFFLKFNLTFKTKIIVGFLLHVPALEFEAT